MTGTTTNSTETELFINGVANTRISVTSNTFVYYTADIAARRSDVVGETAAFFLKSAAKNVSGTLSDVGTVYEVVVARDDVNYLVDTRVSAGTSSLGIYVQGVAGKTIDWRAVIHTVVI